MKIRDFDWRPDAGPVCSFRLVFTKSHVSMATITADQWHKVTKKQAKHGLWFISKYLLLMLLQLHTTAKDLTTTLVRKAQIHNLNTQAKATTYDKPNLSAPAQHKASESLTQLSAATRSSSATWTQLKHNNNTAGGCRAASGPQSKASWDTNSNVCPSEQGPVGYVVSAVGAQNDHPQNKAHNTQCLFSNFLYVCVCVCFLSVCVRSSVFWISAQPHWRHSDRLWCEVDTQTHTHTHTHIES